MLLNTQTSTTKGVNFDERQELVQVVSKAIGRGMDQLIIDTVNGASGTGTVVKM